MSVGRVCGLQGSPEAWGHGGKLSSAFYGSGREKAVLLRVRWWVRELRSWSQERCPRSWAEATGASLLLSSSGASPPRGQGTKTSYIFIKTAGNTSSLTLSFQGHFRNCHKVHLLLRILAQSRGREEQHGGSHAPHCPECGQEAVCPPASPATLSKLL